ncbi:MAG: amidohydrolase family protein [Armatimonadota bacterium]
MSVQTSLQEFVNAIRLIDTHEHLPDEKARVGRRVDPFEEFTVHYLSTDSVVAGLAPEEVAEIRNPAGKSLRERWEMFKRVWPFVKTTGNSRALLLSLRELYGIDDLTDDTIEPLAERMQARNVPGLYRWVINEKSGIDLCLRASYGGTGAFRHPRAAAGVGIVYNTSYGDDATAEWPLVNVMNIDNLVFLNSLAALEDLGKYTDVSIHRLTDLEEAIARMVAQYKQRGNVALKTTIAYTRSLNFAHVTAHEAECALAQLLTPGWRPSYGGPYPRSNEELRPLQDYLFHRVVQCAEAQALPIQIHTGYQEGHGNIVANSNPTLLTNLFIEYPKVTFVLFHLGYPYTDELSVLAKTFQNIYVDFCWNHMGLPAVTRRVLGEMVDCIPCNKLMAFGADFGYIDGVYGHQVLARRNVAAALAQKVDEGFYTMGEAEFLATRLLRENAIDLFGLQSYLATE